MADPTTVDLVEKLIRLATNNPSPQEAGAAALKACELIQKFSIPLGAEVKIVRDAEWRAPSSDFMETVDEILKGTRAASAADWQPADVNGPPQAPGNTLMIQDRELVGREEAFRKQMQRAWQAIREERRKIEAWVHHMRVTHQQDFWGTDHPKPW